MPRQKIAAYVPSDIADKVVVFQREHDLKSLSEALEHILKDYFSTDRINPIQTELNEIKARLAKLEQKQLKPSVSGFDINTNRNTDIDRTGLDRNKLAKRLGVSGPTITKYQQQDRMEELSLKYDPDGTVWHYDHHSELFIPRPPSPLCYSPPSNPYRVTIFT